jgi:orotate phosphoribosyltransferase
MIDKAALGKMLCDVALLRGEFTLRSGRTSSYYFDKYRFETCPQLLKPVAEYLAQMVPEGTVRLAGPALGGVALATAVALETELPFLIVRKAEKGYGTDELIEGPMQEGDTICVVEDVATTGGAALQAVEALRAAGAGDIHALVVLDRQEGAAEAFEEAGVPFQALFTTESLGIEKE